MRFASKDGRDFYIGLLLNWAGDFLLSSVFIMIFARDAGLLGIIGVFIALEIALGCTFIFRSIFRIGGFFLFWKDSSVARVFDILVEKKYPLPHEFEESPLGYLRYIATNKEFDMDLRIKAAEDIGVLVGTSKIMSIGYNIIFEEALEKYRRYLVEKGIKNS